MRARMREMPLRLAASIVEAEAGVFPDSGIGKDTACDAAHRLSGGFVCTTPRDFR